MGTWKQLLRKLLFPGNAVVLLSIPASAALLIHAFGFARGDEPVVYLSYTISAYSLVIVCVRFFQWSKKFSALLHRNRYIHRYLTDLSFRTHLSLYLSVGLNLIYAVMKLFFGVYYRSVWFGTLGVYYTLLTAMRFLLLRHVNRHTFGKEPIPEWNRYRLCGAILLPMTLALSGVTLLVIEKNEGFQYPGYLIYVMAMYAFYAAITAAVHIVKYPNHAFSRSQLMDEFWGVESDTGLRAVDVYITKLRDKFDRCPDFTIKTIRGLGYKAVLK